MDALSSLIILGMFWRSVVCSDQVSAVLRCLKKDNCSDDGFFFIVFHCTERETNFDFSACSWHRKHWHHLCIGHTCGLIHFFLHFVARVEPFTIDRHLLFVLLQIQIEFLAPADSSWADLCFLWKMNSLLHALSVLWHSIGPVTRGFVLLPRFSPIPNPRFTWRARACTFAVTNPDDWVPVGWDSNRNGFLILRKMRTIQWPAVG